MGLPLFITPVEPEVSSKAAEKIASGPRSSIRRQRTLRGPHARITAEVRRRRMLGLMPESTEPEAYEISETQQGVSPNQTQLPSPASLQSRAMRMFEQERMRLRDPLSFERQQPSNIEDGPLMPPVPESRDYTGIEERQREIYRLRRVGQDLRRMARRHPAPTPPYIENDLAYITRTESPRLSSSLTPVLSPSHQPSMGDSETTPRQPLEESDYSFTARGQSSSEVSRPSLSERVQALNRTANNMERSRRLIRQARLDGLGDRDRSLSPEGGSAWDTLLTSITPDPQPPSAGSSFVSTSAAAAAASSSSSGPSSASTSMTSLDRTMEHDCEVSESGSNTEDEDDMYELHEIHGSRGDRFWRTYADVVTARGDRTTRNDVEHLSGLHRIISRMARRDEVPETYWASAGLSRNLRREPTD